jgi:hypothetical protein
MTETKLYTEIHNEFKIICNKYNKKLHFTRLESLIEPGIPDINICIAGDCEHWSHTEHGHEFWIECKVNNYQLSPMQISWQTQRRMAGGRVYNLEFSGSVYVLYDISQNWHQTDIKLSKIIEHIYEKETLSYSELLELGLWTHWLK